MFIQYNTIRDFDSYFLSKNIQSENSTFNVKEKDVLKQTQDNCSENEGLFLKTRSVKLKRASFETSFHRKYLDQHVQCFKKSLKIYLEKCYCELFKDNISQVLRQIFGQSQKNYSGGEKLKYLIEKDGNLFGWNEKRMFILDLKYEEGLNEFFSQICSQVPSQVATELIYLADLFWKGYLQNCRLQLTLEEIKIIVQNIMQSEEMQTFSKGDQLMNFSNAQIKPDLNQNQVEANLRAFLKIYGVTLLMVIEQYFLNLFIQGGEKAQKIQQRIEFRDISNDSFSDEESDYDLCGGTKKRKL